MSEYRPLVIEGPRMNSLKAREPNQRDLVSVWIRCTVLSSMQVSRRSDEVAYAIPTEPFP